MDEIYSKYIAVLRAFLHGTSPGKTEPEELGKMMELATINSTGGIVNYTYISHPELLEQEQRTTMRRQCLGEIGRYAQRVALAKQLATELDRNGIPFILFKGFVVRDYYPVPELRTFGDVDFIIRREDRLKSDELMLSLGYARIDDWEPSYSYRKGAEYYELHSRVIGFNVSDKADYVSYFDDIWDHTCRSQVLPLSHAYELEPAFHFIYLLTHIAKHISNSGAGIRMYLDLALFVKHFGAALDWQWVVQELKKLRLMDFANVAMSAVKLWFDVDSPFPLNPVGEEIMEDFTEFTLSGGVYGYIGRDKGTVFLKQNNRNEEDVSKFRTLLYHAFPPADVLANKYDYLNSHRWLLPVAWTQRLIDSRKDWSRFADHTKSILEADDEKVLKLKRIYKEIGL